MPSLARNSLARFLAEGLGLTFGMMAGMITARWLGPSGKGLFSALTFLSSLLMQICCVGLGDAAIVLIGQKKASVQESLSSTVTAIFISSLIGMLGLWVFCRVQFSSDWSSIRTAVMAACVALPISLCAYVLGHILNSQERIISASIVLAITSGMSTLGTWLFIVMLPLSILGGVLAGLFGSAAGLAIILMLLVNSGLSLRPRWNAHYLISALRYGAGVQASYLLMMMSSRVDILLVYSMAGQAEAGYYSVALALGTLVVYVPWALSTASFPRLAYMDEAEAMGLTACLCRFGLASAVLSGLCFMLVIPVAVPFFFGRAYLPAVIPALILLISGVLWSAQWLLCRAWAARGKPGLLFRSFSSSLLVMCLLDFLLIPSWGLIGAAVAATMGPAAGLMACFMSYRRLRGPVPRLKDFLPRAIDFRSLVTLSMRLVFPAHAGAPAPTSKEG